MRTLTILRRTLIALSLVTLASTAAAGSPDAAKTKQDSSIKAAKSKVSSKTAHPAKAAVASTHRGKTSQVSKSQTASRSRQPASSSPKTAPAAAKTRASKSDKVASKSTAGTSKKTGVDSRAAAPHGKTARRAEPKKAAAAPKACFHDPVEIVRGSDNHTESLVLTRCNGRPVDGALDKLTRLIAPNMPQRAADNKGKGTRSVTPALKNLDSGVLSRVQAIASHYPGKAIRIASAFRPLAARSYHQTGRALDLVVAGVRNEDLVAFCRTLPDTGCGYYPNSTFIHLDVRSPGTGHVYWIDASKPGEAPRYVTTWPEKTDAVEKPAAVPPGVHADEHPHEHRASAEAPNPAANAPAETPRQPLTGDLELDSTTDNHK